MSEQTIDKLNIEINTKAKDNSDGLDKLAKSIQRLKSSVGAGVDKLSGIAASLGGLGNSIADLKGKSGTISSLANSINKLNDVKTNHISGNVDTLVQSLKTLGGIDPELKTMISDLSTLAKSGNGGVTQNALRLQAEAAKAQATIDKSVLTSAKAQEGLKAIAEKNKSIADTAIFAEEAEKSLADAISRVPKSGFSNEASKYIPDSVLPDYYSSDEERLKDLRKRLSGVHKSYMASELIDGKLGLEEAMNAASGLGSKAASSLNEVSNSSNKATGFVNKLKQAFNSAKEGVSSFDSSARSAFRFQNLYGAYFILRGITRTIGGFITNINSYIEDMNLFDVAMGKDAQSAEKLAQSMQNVLGIDAGEAERFMGVIKQITSSFGVANKQSTVMSENLTQLGYDLASYYNISTQKSFEKLESGLTGQSRALRELGIDVSEARLQQELYNLGINEKVKNLSQADKAELRYIAIMKQTTSAQGDMARTIQTPANALRVLQAQFQITGRAIGSVFIPALEAILPPITAVIEVIGDLASELASFFGFKLPKINYSSLNTGLSGVADDADKAANGVGDIGKNAKDSKKQLDNLIGGFDELHVLNSDTGNGSNLGAGSGGNILSDIDLPSYNALSSAISNNIDSLKKKIRDFLDAFQTDPLTTFSDALWGVGGAFDNLGKWLSSMDYADILGGIAAALTTYGLTKNPLLAIAVGTLTMALSHLLPEKSKIDLLNGSLAILGEALVLKAFTGMSFKLALGISALLTSGLVELIGKDNAINLLASSLTGLGMGILAFTFSGNLPLAVGIGLVSTAISDLSIHFSDMQIAPALLSGLSAAMVAFKWGGFSQGAAGLVGIGMAITSFAELNKISPELRINLLGLAGAIEGVGLAIKLGFGVEGAIITAVALAFIGLGVGLIQASEDAKKADLESRFGSIKLSAQDVEDIAKRLTTTPWTVKIDAAIEAQNKVKEFENTLKSDIDALNKLNWKVSIGMELTKDEQSTYKETINSFIKDAKAYVQQQQYAITVSISAAFAPGSDTAKNLTQFVNTYYGNAQKQLDSLGKQLSDEVNKAFSDGILTESEYLKISNIEQKMQKLIDKISDAEYKAKLDNLTADVAEKGLAADSFKDLQAQIQKSAQDRLSKADEVRLKAKAAAELELDEDGNKAEYNKAIAEAQEYYNQQKASIDLAGLSVSLDTVNSKFSSELKAAQPVWSTGVKEAMSNGWKIGIDNSKETYTTSISDLINSVSGSYQKELNNMEKSGKISTAARQNITSLVSALQPTETDLKQIASAATAAGKQVPEDIAKGISDVEQLRAISGNADAINYMIGKKFSTDSVFLNTLATVKDAGKDIDKNVAQGLTDNLQLVKDSSSGTIIGIKDSVTGKVTEITPTLKKNLSELGVNMTNSFVGAVNGKIPDATKAGENLVQGQWNGMDKKRKEMGPFLTDWANDPWKIFSNKNEIHSPSALFERGGNNIVQGLWNGTQDTWKGFMNWWTNLHIPVPHFKFGWESLDNYDDLAAKAAKKMGFKKIPTMGIDWYAKGGVFDSTSIIGVGEYQNASTNPEVVAPQSIIRETVEESNESLVVGIAKLIEIAEKIAEKDTTVNLDGRKINESNNKYNANRGYNLGLQAT